MSYRSETFVNNSSESSSFSPISLDVSSTLFAAKELLPLFLWTVAKGFVHTAKPSTAPAESNELKEITEVFVGPFG